MKYFLLLLGLFVYSPGYSKTADNTKTYIEKVKHYLNQKHWSHKDSILSFLFGDPEFYSRDSIDREIDFGHWQILFYDGPYDFIIQGEGSHAYFFSVVESNYEQQSHSLVLKKVNNQQLLLYLGLYNCKYHSNYSINSYFDLTIERFAFGCGAVGTPSGSVSDMYALVRARDKKAIVAMATSLLPEKRTAGVIGLYYLQKLGIALSAEEMELIRIGQESSTRIMYCEGCTVRESEEMRNFLKTKDLDMLFEWMKRVFNTTE